MYFLNDKEMFLSVLPLRSMNAPAGSLIGRVCMVTGATGALGKATANAFAQRGARVVLVSRDEARAHAIVTSVRQSSGAGSVEALQADLSALRSVRNLAKSFGETRDRLDVLVNAAAVFTRKRIETGDGFELMFVTNFLGPFLLTNLLVPALRAGAPSRVITISAPTTTELDFADLRIERVLPRFQGAEAIMEGRRAPRRGIVSRGVIHDGSRRLRPMELTISRIECPSLVWTKLASGDRSSGQATRN